MTKTFARLLVLLACLTGCASERHPQVNDQLLEDSRTAERVREALAAAPGYRFDGTQVSVAQGSVRLTGIVHTDTQRHTAEVLASKVSGVKSVENQLVVRE